MSNISLTGPFVNLHPKLIHHLHLILTHLKVYSKCFYLWITSLFLPPLLV
jgi:hypothetical protein